MKLLRRRMNEDESAPETETSKQRGGRPWSSYADHFTVVIRHADEHDETPYDSAVAVGFGEVGAYVPLEEFVPELVLRLEENRGGGGAPLLPECAAREFEAETR
jgi:hypothetical protein